MFGQELATAMFGKVNEKFGQNLKILLQTA
jgi:hypothetical protein